MAPATDPLELERRGWEALATGADDAAAYYRDVLADDAVMVFPGGVVVDGRDAILSSMGGPPWSSYELADEVVHRHGDTAVVVYRAAAEREGQPTYEALISTVYVRDGDRWRLVLHQQTPA